MAEQEINLLPEEKLVGEAALGKWLSFFLTSGRIIVILTLLVVVVAFAVRFFFDQELFKVKKALVQKQQILTSLSDLESQIIFTQSQIKGISTILDQTGQIDPIISNIVSIVPDGLTFQTLTVSTGKVSLIAKAIDAVAFNGFIDKLSNSPWAKQVDVESVSGSAAGIVFTVKYVPEIGKGQ